MGTRGDTMSRDRVYLGEDCSGFGSRTHAAAPLAASY
jgi:hypothetical protein